jgi:hypothetical protein
MYFKSKTEFSCEILCGFILSFEYFLEENQQIIKNVLSDCKGCC